MDDRLLPAGVLLGAVCLAVAVSVSMIRNLASEVARAARESERDTTELKTFLKRTTPAVREYEAHHQPNENEAALNL